MSASAVLWRCGFLAGDRRDSGDDDGAGEAARDVEHAGGVDAFRRRDIPHEKDQERQQDEGQADPLEDLSEDEILRGPLLHPGQVEEAGEGDAGEADAQCMARVEDAPAQAEDAKRVGDELRPEGVVQDRGDLLRPEMRGPR